LAPQHHHNVMTPTSSRHDAIMQRNKIKKQNKTKQNKKTQICNDNTSQFAPIERAI
jgi:hypothetical protein